MKDNKFNLRTNQGKAGLYLQKQLEKCYSNHTPRSETPYSVENTICGALLLAQAENHSKSIRTEPRAVLASGDQTLLL